MFDHKTAIFLALVLIGITVVPVLSMAKAPERGVAVQLRAADDPTAPVAETVQLYARSYALVIGIDKYTSGWPSLNKAVEDAQAVADELRQRGFEVTFKKNLDAASLQGSLKEFFAIKGADPDARLFLWYAGHGYTLKGEGFLVPADAPPPTSPEFKLKALHLRDFGGLMRLADSKHVLSVFDSCFAGTIFVVRAGAAPAAVTRATTLPVRQFLSSGDADQTVSDDGTFRKLFLRALRGDERADANGDGYLTVSELGLYLADRVTNLTEQAQTPRFGKLRDPDYDRGDFIFVLPSRATAATAQVEATEAVPDDQDAIVEITFWATVAGSDNIAELESYLQRYPDGNFADVARRRIAALKTGAGAKQQAKAPAAEDEQKTLQVAGRELVVADQAEKSGWAPMAPSQRQQPFRIKGQTELAEAALPQVSAGVARAPVAKDAPQLLEGQRVPAKAWMFSNPQGDGKFQVDGKWIHMLANAGRNLWDCRRHQAPLLTVPAPKTESWTALVRFEMPSRIGHSHVGLTLWNGREEGAVHALYVGPSETAQVTVGGSYRDDCSAHPTDLARLRGNHGDFQTSYPGTSGWLRISKKGNEFTFYVMSPFKKDWQPLGTVLTTVKDGFVRVGLLTKTWGNQPVQVSFHDFRLLPGVAEFPVWAPDYYATLEQNPEVSFSGEVFADFEWSDPQGDSLHEITGPRVRLKTPGGHNLWDCRRHQAPILTVQAPAAEIWTAEVKFEMPTRVGASHAGMVLWNGSEDTPVHALYVGPSETNAISVSGSYRDDCSAQPSELARYKGNSGDFSTAYAGAVGWLRISRTGDTFSFFVRSPHKKQWQKLGSVLTTRKDGFNRIGLMAKTWAGTPVDITFSDFKLAVGVAGSERFIPSYFSRLNSGEAEVFSGREYSDFEWSDPQGDSVNEIRGDRVLLKANGGHNIWDCTRGLAPMLTVEAPPRESWVAQVKFELPARVAGSQVGLVLWDGREDQPVHTLYFGPAEGGLMAVAGSIQDDCSAHPNELAMLEGNEGEFQIKYEGRSGWLRIVKTGTRFGFWVRSTGNNDWQQLGSALTTVKDELNRIGMIAKTWAGEPVEVSFSEFTLLPGTWR